MRPTLFLIRKEFAQIFRDPVLLFQLVAPPLIELLLVTSAATFEVKSLDLHVVDRDRTPASRRLVRSFTSSGRFQVGRSSVSNAAARQDLVAGDVGAVLEIPEGFARELPGPGRARIRLTFDGTEGVVAGTARSYARRILAGFGAPAAPDPSSGGAFDRGAAGEETAGVTARAGTGGGPGSVRLDVRTRRWFNPTADFADYMALGVLVILVTIVGTVMTALNIAREREQGTIEQLNVSPLTKGQFVAGKLVPFWLLGLVEVVVGLALARAVFDVPMEGSLAIVFLATGLYLFTALAVGLVLSTASRTQQQAQFLAFFVIVLYLFLSGIFTPVTSMPEWAQWLAEVNPMKHFIVVVRSVLLKGAGTADVARELAALAGFAILSLPASVRLYSKRSA